MVETGFQAMCDCNEGREQLGARSGEGGCNKLAMGGVGGLIVGEVRAGGGSPWAQGKEETEAVMDVD